MRTPFTLHFDRSGTPLTRIGRQPFTPVHAMPYAGEETSLHYVGGACQVIYRWYDAFDVFVATLDVRLAEPLEIPTESHLSDLHLVYQLKGQTGLELPMVASPGPITLPEYHRMELYTPPTHGALRIQPPYSETVVVVPKGDWVTRHPPRAATPMERVIQDLHQLHPVPRMLAPRPVTPEMSTWLHVMLTLPHYEGMLMDDALNGPTVQLIEAHRADYRQEERESRTRRIIQAARLLARELVARMDGGQPPTATAVAAALNISERRLRDQHYLLYRQRFIHYIHDCRMQEAKNRLRAGTPVSAAAYALGWTEVAHFSAQFRKYTGMSPREYLKRDGH